MKYTLLALAITSLVGCSSVKRGQGELEPIRNQKLSTSFKSDTIRVETDCSWYTFNKSDCAIISIESVGTASSNGNTESNLRTALIRAGDKARANVRHFIQEDVSSTRVNNTIAKNVEKANEVKMSDSDAEKDTNYSIRENSNDTAYQLTESIRVNASGILRGFRVTKQEVVGKQEVAVTIRWDKDSERTSNNLRKQFGN